MMDSLKNKIVKLENNKEYFVLETLIDNNINYMLLLNLVDDKEKIFCNTTVKNGIPCRLVLKLITCILLYCPR